MEQLDHKALASIPVIRYMILCVIRKMRVGIWMIIGSTHLNMARKIWLMHAKEESIVKVVPQVWVMINMQYKGDRH